MAFVQALLENLIRYRWCTGGVPVTGLGFFRIQVNPNQTVDNVKVEDQRMYMLRVLKVRIKSMMSVYM